MTVTTGLVKPELLEELDELLEWPEELLLEELLLDELDELEELEELLLWPEELLLLDELDELELLVWPEELPLLDELLLLELEEVPEVPPTIVSAVSVGRPVPVPQSPKLAVPPLAASAAS